MNTTPSNCLDPFVIVRGGLVQNDPTLPVVDLDLLDQDFYDTSDIPAAIDLIEQLTQIDAKRFADDITDCVALVERIGTREDHQNARRAAALSHDTEKGHPASAPAARKTIATQGWTPQTLADLAQRFIAENGHQDAWAAYLADVADAENTD